MGSLERRAVWGSLVETKKESLVVQVENRGRGRQGHVREMMRNCLESS